MIRINIVQRLIASSGINNSLFNSVMNVKGSERCGFLSLTVERCFFNADVCNWTRLRSKSCCFFTLPNQQEVHTFGFLWFPVSVSSLLYRRSAAVRTAGLHHLLTRHQMPDWRRAESNAEPKEMWHSVAILTETLGFYTGGVNYSPHHLI